MRKLCMMCFIVVLCSGLLFAKGNKNTPSDKNSEEKNKATARQVFDDLWTRGRYELLDSMYEKNCLVHYPTETMSLEQAVANGKEWRRAFPDLVARPNRVTGNGDMVVVDWTAQGTNKVQAHGLSGKGKQGTARGTSKFRFENGKIAEVWVTWSEEELRKQVK